jgi:hypothetical protein
MSGDIDPSGICSRGKTFRFLLAALALAAVSLPPRAWAASADTAGDASSCSGNMVPIEIMTPGYGNEVKRSAAEISDSFPHFRAFVTAVTERVAARLAREQLCINNDPKTAEWKRSLLQFVYWHLNLGSDFIVPVLQGTGGQPIDCRISSPWVDLVVMRGPAPRVRGIFRWNERQLLVDQAVLYGAYNVLPPGVAMPLNDREFRHFANEYQATVFEKRPAAKPIGELVPPDILWLFRRSAFNDHAGPFAHSTSRGMRQATEKGAEGYMELVLALVDRCFASTDGANLRYNSILDAPWQYRIDMPVRRGR